MAPIFGAWTSNRRKLYRRIHDRLTKTGGCSNVRYKPNRRRRREIVADVDPTAFLGRKYSTETAQLRIEFTLGRSKPQYIIHWWESDTERSIGWHQDQTEPEYGPVHFQVEHPDGTTDRKRATYIADEHPYQTFERRLTQIDDKLGNLG